MSLKLCGQPKHKRFVGLHFQESVENLKLHTVISTKL